MFAALMVESAAAAAAEASSELEIVVGDVVLRAGADAQEGLLTRTIRAAQAATA